MWNCRWHHVSWCNGYNSTVCLIASRLTISGFICIQMFKSTYFSGLWGLLFWKKVFVDYSHFKYMKCYSWWTGFTYTPIVALYTWVEGRNVNSRVKLQQNAIDALWHFFIKLKVRKVINHSSTRHCMECIRLMWLPLLEQLVYNLEDFSFTRKK